MSGVKDYGYCQIYLRGGTRQAVTELIEAVLDAQVDDHWTFRAGRLLFETRRNPDAGLAADFIGWPIKIEAETDDPDPVLVDAVSQVLRTAWDHGYDAVAACDFEDELPDLGGLPRYR